MCFINFVVKTQIKKRMVFCSFIMDLYPKPKTDASSLKAGIKELNRDISLLRKDFEKYKKQNGKITTGIDWELRKHMETVDNYQLDQEKRFGGVEQDIAELHSENQKLKESDIKFGELHKGFIQDLEIVENKMRGVEDVLDKESLTKIQQDIEVVAEGLKEMKDLLAKNGEEVSGSRGTIKALELDFHALNSLTRKQAQAHLSTKSQVDNLAALGNDTNSVIEMLVKKLNQMHGRVKEQEQIIGTMRNKLDKMYSQCMRTFVVD